MAPSTSIVVNIADATDPTRLLKVNADGTINANADNQAQYFKGSLGTMRETIPRYAARDSSVTIGATGVLWSFPVLLYAGDSIASIATRSGNTGANTPTHYWFALYNPADGLIGQSADQTTTPWASATVKDLALVGGPYTIATTGVHRIAVLMTATAIITVCGQLNSLATLYGGIVTGMEPFAQTHDTGLTTTAPATLGTATNVDGAAYFVAHS